MMCTSCKITAPTDKFCGNESKLIIEIDSIGELLLHPCPYLGNAELLKGRIPGSRIQDIFKKNSGHFW
jgi:hypothetical protein